MHLKSLKKNKFLPCEIIHADHILQTVALLVFI